MVHQPGAEITVLSPTGGPTTHPLFCPFGCREETNDDGVCHLSTVVSHESKVPSFYRCQEQEFYGLRDNPSVPGLVRLVVAVPRVLPMDSVHHTRTVLVRITVFEGNRQGFVVTVPD